MSFYPYPWDQQAGLAHYQQQYAAQAGAYAQAQANARYQQLAIQQQQQEHEALRQRILQQYTLTQQQAHPSAFAQQYYGQGGGHPNYGYHDQPPQYGYGPYGNEYGYGQEPTPATQEPAPAPAAPAVPQTQCPLQNAAKPEAVPTPGMPCPPPMDPAEATRLAREAGHTQLVEGVDCLGTPYLYLPSRPKGLIHTIKSWRWDY